MMLVSTMSFWHQEQVRLKQGLWLENLCIMGKKKLLELA